MVNLLNLTVPSSYKIQITNAFLRRISDKLIEELIIEIREELEMKGIIEKLFEMEFQEF